MSIIRTLVLILLAASVSAQDGGKVKNMSQHLGFDNIESIFAVHYETMDQDKGHKKISFIKERKTLEKIKSGLDGLTSQGTVSKLWRTDVPTVRVFILCESGKYAVMDIVNHRIARVGGYGVNDFEEEKQVVTLIEGS